MVSPGCPPICRLQSNAMRPNAEKTSSKIITPRPNPKLTRRRAKATERPRRSCRRRPAGLRGKSVRPRRRQQEHQHRHGRTCRGVRPYQGPCDQLGIGKACQRADAQQQRQRNRAGSIGADPAVAHDLKLLVAGFSAAEPIGGVGKSIFMQATGDRYRHRSRQRSGRKNCQCTCVREPINQRPDQSDQHTATGSAQLARASSSAVTGAAWGGGSRVENVTLIARSLASCPAMDLLGSFARGFMR